MNSFGCIFFFFFFFRLFFFIFCLLRAGTKAGIFRELGILGSFLGSLFVCFMRVALFVLCFFCSPVRVVIEIFYFFFSSAVFLLSESSISLAVRKKFPSRDGVCV